MNRYELRATLNKVSNVTYFEDINDIEAMYTGIFATLNRASKSLIWSKGHIALTNLNTGELVKEMAGKQ